MSQPPVWGALGFGLGGLILAVLGLIVLILWTLLPFAVFGIKGRLDNLSRQLSAVAQELQWTNYLLKVGFELREERDESGNPRWVRGSSIDTAKTAHVPLPGGEKPK